MIEAQTIRGDQAVFGRLTSFAQETGRKLLDEFLLTGGNLAVSLAYSQQPYGLGRDAERAGREAVARDIGHVFISPSAFYRKLELEDPALASQFWKAWRSRDLALMERTAQGSRAGSGLDVLALPDERMHGRRRGRGGRVRGKKPNALVTDGQALRDYVKRVQARVGLTKSGWADAAADCGGTSGIPQWASGRHGGRHGGATIDADPDNPAVVLRNEVPWAEEGLPLNEERAAIQIAEERLVMRLEKILGANGEVPF